MREHMGLFRGKRIDTGEWVEGALIPWKDGDAEICASATDNAIEMDKFLVGPDTIGECTGKMDVNGKKVFEHDILQLYTVWVDGTRTKSVKVIVQWWKNDQCYVLTTKEGYLCDDFGNYGRPEYFEVIGNIHDNPELLKGGEG